MAFFKWLDSYSIGFKMLDEQHKKLIETIDHLHETAKIGAKTDAMGTAIASLITHTITHFSTEERFMQEHEYPGYQDHRRIHITLTRRIKDIYDRHKTGAPGVTPEAMNFLRSWLIDHMQREDQAYSRFIVARIQQRAR